MIRFANRFKRTILAVIAALALLFLASWLDDSYIHNEDTSDDTSQSVGDKAQVSPRPEFQSEATTNK